MVSNTAVPGPTSVREPSGGAMPLTSVTMRGQEMGAAAAELMLDGVRGDTAAHEHRTVVLEPTLVVRERTVGRRRVVPADE